MSVLSTRLSNSSLETLSHTFRSPFAHWKPPVSVWFPNLPLQTVLSVVSDASFGKKVSVPSTVDLVCFAHFFSILVSHPLFTLVPILFKQIPYTMSKVCGHCYIPGNSLVISCFDSSTSTKSCLRKQWLLPERLRVRPSLLLSPPLHFTNSDRCRTLGTFYLYRSQLGFRFDCRFRSCYHLPTRRYNAVPCKQGQG